MKSGKDIVKSGKDILMYLRYTFAVPSLYLRFLLYREIGTKKEQQSHSVTCHMDFLSFLCFFFAFERSPILYYYLYIYLINKIRYVLLYRKNEIMLLGIISVTF